MSPFYPEIDEKGIEIKMPIKNDEQAERIGIPPIKSSGKIKTKGSRGNKNAAEKRSSKK